MVDKPPVRRLIPWGSFPETDEPWWTLTELAEVTRRAVIPSVFVQIYKSNPTLGLLLDKAKDDADHG